MEGGNLRLICQWSINGTRRARIIVSKDGLVLRKGAGAGEAGLRMTGLGNDSSDSWSWNEGHRDLRRVVRRREVIM